MMLRFVKRTAWLVVALVCLLLAGRGALSLDLLASAESVALNSTAWGLSPIVENVGQFDEAARFQIRHGNGVTWLGEGGLWLTVFDAEALLAAEERMAATGERDMPIPAANVRLTFFGANPAPALEPFDRLNAHVSYLIGDDPAGWRADVPVWGGLRYRNLYPGIDLVLSARESGGDGTLSPWHLELSAGADPHMVQLRVEGAQSVQVGEGQILVSTAAGGIGLPLLGLAGGAWPEGGALTPEMVVTEAGSQDFVISAPLATDGGAAAPTAIEESLELFYSTYLGGSDWDRGYGIAVDSSGMIYVAGRTPSSDFPTTPGAWDTTLGSLDAFVAKVNPAGSGLDDLVYATFIGGSGSDSAYGLALSGDEANITGDTASADFPTTTGAFDPECGTDGACNGLTDAVFARLNTDGTALLYSTHIGDRGTETGYDIAIMDGNAFITGRTYSSGFPTTVSAYDRSCGTDGRCNPVSGTAVADAFLVEIAPNGSGSNDLLYGTFIGGAAYDVGNGIATAGGHAFVTGESRGAIPGFAAYAGDDDAFVARIAPAGNGAADLVYGTHLGGTGDELGSGIAVRGSVAFVSGETRSSDFLTGTVANSFGGGLDDAFIAQLDGAGAVTYAGYLGGDDQDYGRDVAIDSSGAAVVIGYTWSLSTTFPVTEEAYDRTHNGTSDIFVARIDLASSKPEHITYATYLGGAGGEDGVRVVLDSEGLAYLIGSTASGDYPITVGAFAQVLNGSSDGVITKLRVALPPGLSLEKSTNGLDADEPPGPYLLPDDPVAWEYVVTNTGGYELTGIVVSDDQGVSVSCPGSSLLPEESMTCTASGTAAEGQYSNLGTATGDPGQGLDLAVATDPSHYFGAAPAIDLEKYTNGENADEGTGPLIRVGETVTWTYVVTNTGNVVLSGIAVTDDLEGAASCPYGSLGPKQSMTCIITSTATVDQYANSALATGNPPGGLDAVSDSDVSHYFGADPVVSVEKYTNGQDADAAPGPSILFGDPVAWAYTVTNGGNVSLSGIAVVDDQGVEVSCPETELAVGASTVCTAGGTAEEGQYTNTATVTAIFTVDSEVSAQDMSHYYGVLPEITIEKRTNGEDADEAPGPFIEYGGPVAWSYVVTNTGNVALIDVVVSDDQPGVVVGCPADTLDPDEAMTCTAAGTAVSGQYSNVGTVMAMAAPEGMDPVEVSDSDPSHYYGSDPSLAIRKLTNGEDADSPPGVYLLVGDAVTWTYVVTNTGNVALTNVVVSDDQPGVVVDCPGTSLAVDESMTCTATGDAVAGQYENTGTVSGKPPVGADVQAEDLSHYFGVAAEIAIGKRTNGEDADEAPGPTIQAGTLLTWTYEVTNTGNVALTGLVVTDDQGVEIDCPTTELAVEASTVCTATGFAIVGQYMNTGTAEGSPPADLPSVSASDASHYFGGDPAIQVEKSTNGEDADSPTGPTILVGAPVLWEYTVENVGNLPLSAIEVSDSDPDVVVGCPASELAVGESMVCSATGTAETGQYSNTGTATGTPSDGLDAVSDSDPSHYFGADPAVSVEKYTNGQDADTAPGPYILFGDPVAWAYTVTNEGNVPLIGIAVVDDQGVEVSCPETDLAAGASMVCTAGGTAEEGQYANTATVTAMPTVGSMVSAQDMSHYFGVLPEITIEKRTNGEDADEAPGPVIEYGGPVAWSYVVTNTGNVALIDVVVSDDQPGVVVGCPADTLDPDEAMTCTATGEAIAGQYGNVGTVTAMAAPGGIDPVEVSDSDPSHYYGSKPSLAIRKLTNGEDADSPPGVYLLVGDAVTWTYVVTNTGNVALTNVVVSDDQPGVVVDCPGTSLAVDESMTCTSTGAAVAGQYENTGTVSGKPPVGADASAEDLSHYFGVAAEIAIGKRTNGEDADEAPGPTIQAGTLLTWTYEVTNTGNVALTGLVVTDDQGVEIECPTTELAVEASTVCTATGFAIVGQYMNTGTAEGSPPAGLPSVSASDVSHYFGGDPAIQVEKSTNGQDADSPTGPTIVVGTTVLWEYTVENVGNLPLSVIEVTDSDLGVVGCPASELAVGESMVCSATGTAETGQYSNTGMVTGTPPDGLDDVSDSDPSHYFGINPSIDLEKHTNGQDADEPTGPYIITGESVIWTYHVTNKGDILLLDIAVTDNQLGEIACPRTSLGEGEAMTCTVTGVALEGQQGNEGSVSATPAGASVVVSDTDPSHYFGASLLLTIEKETNGQDADDAPGPLVLEGSTVDWTYQVTNGSNVALTEVAVTDDRVDPVTCPHDTLDAGESMTCTASDTALSGQYANLGTVTGRPPGDLEVVTGSDPSHYFGVSPSVALAKRTNGQDADDPPGPYIWEGMPVTWTYSITNTGNITLTGLSVWDDQLGSVTCPGSTLAADESMTCMVAGVAELGQYANSAEVTGSPLVGPPVSASDDSHYYGISPSIEINKYTNGEDADVEPWPTIYAGEVVTWTYVVTNSGDITLSQIAVTDDQIGAVTCPGSSLAPSLSMTCEMTGTAISGSYANVATVVALPPGGLEVSASDPSHYLGRKAEPSIDIEKLTNGLDADGLPGPYIPVGDPVTWKYIVTNQGNVEVTSIVVTDSVLGEVLTCPQDHLNELESMECVVTGSAVAGQYSNVGTVTGTAVPGGLDPVEVSDSDPSHYFGSDPGIALTKLTNGQDADEEPGTYILAGETVTWTYRVTNTGNVTLSGVSVTDDQVGEISCPKNVLSAGESMTCTATGEAVPGQYANLATVTGRPQVGLLVDASDADYYFGAIVAASFEKRTNGEDADSAPGLLIPVDEAVTWTYHVTNTSNVPLSVAVSDSEGVPVTCDESSVPPTGTVICSGEGTATPGQYANTGTATLTPPGELAPLVLGDESHYFGSKPRVELQKLTNGVDADEEPGPIIPVGAAVEWTYVVVNTGNVTLTQVEVTDDQGVDVSCPTGTLAPDEEMVCTATGTASVGQYANIGTVTGRSPIDEVVSAADPSHYFGSQPGIWLEKHTNGEDADVPPGPSLLAGQAVAWTYHVTNTGNIALANVHVTDDQGVVVDCPRTTLGPDESMTCTASGVAEAGQYINVGTARGTPPVGAIVSDTDPSHYSAITAEPAIGIQKLTNGEDADQAPGPYLLVGAPVEWTYRIANAGNVQLSDITLWDDQIGPIGCPKDVLEVEEWMECRVEGTAEPGQYSNRGTVTGTPPIGDDVMAHDDSHYFGMVPEIALSKRTNGVDADGTPGSYLIEGEAVQWTYVVTNSGNIVLSQVAVADDQGVEVSCPADVLDAGESMTCTAEGVAVVGQYGNVGTASGLSPEDYLVSATDASHYFGIRPEIEIQKYTNGQDADQIPGPSVLEGLSVQWTYVVSNTGDVELTEVTVVDDQGVEPVCPKTVLAPDEQMTCTASGVSVAGQYSNLGTATGTHPGGGTVQATDPSHYLGVAIRPVVDVQKSTNGQDADLPPGPYVPVGEPVEWEYLVTNSGNVALIELTVEDDQGVAVTCPGDSLDPVQSMTCTGSGVAMAGQYTNVVTATAVVLRTGEIISDTDPSHYYGTILGIELEKLTNNLDADEAPGPAIPVGRTVTWTYRVTNTGNVPLTAVAVSDDHGLQVSCPHTTLAAGLTMACTATGVAEAGPYVNIGSVSGAFGGQVVTDSDPSHYYGLYTIYLPLVMR